MCGRRFVGQVGAGEDVQLGEDFAALHVVGREASGDFEGGDGAVGLLEACAADLTETVPQLPEQWVARAQPLDHPAVGAFLVLPRAFLGQDLVDRGKRLHAAAQVVRVDAVGVGKECVEGVVEQVDGAVAVAQLVATDRGRRLEVLAAPQRVALQLGEAVDDLEGALPHSRHAVEVEAVL